MNACAAACDHCMAECLRETQVSRLADCIRHDLDCASACRFASAAVSRRSAQVQQICSLCALLCEVCAGECERHEHAHCQACADACRRCAEICRTMA
nr:four-helix bundle copper-binding protein [Burkholderia gladioli]